MAAAERGSFLWMMFAITQVFLSIKLIGEVEGWITTLFGGGAAAAFMLALIVVAVNGSTGIMRTAR